MKQPYFLGLWLAATTAAAQAPTLPPPTPLPTVFRAGSYQLLEVAGWQAAKLSYNGVPELLVQNASDKDGEPLVLVPGQVRAFTIGRDTFDVVHNLAGRGAGCGHFRPAAVSERGLSGG